LPFNPKNEKQVSRLRESLSVSRRRLEPFRRRHKRSVEQYVGLHYADDGAEAPVPVNLMELALNIYERHLAARPPQVAVYTKNGKFRPAGLKLESVANRSLKDFSVHQSIRRCVRSALLSMGIAKVGTKVTGEYEEGGFSFASTAPYVEQVLLDDWVHDMTARSMNEVDYCGNRYRASLEEVKADKSFNRKLTEKLQQHEFDEFNEEGDERIHTISQGYGGAEGEFIPKTELWEIWLPHDKLLVTLSDQEGTGVLRTVEWEGPDNRLGPFHPLWFSEVDGQSMPLSPAMLWTELHDTVNGLYRKMVRQARRGKIIGVTRGDDTEDAERIRRTSDGEIVAVDNPDAVQEKALGGIDQRSFGFMVHTKDLFSWMAGNLEALGGLGPQSDTASQDAMLLQSSSRRISALQDAVTAWTQRILSDFCFWLWEDPLQSYSTHYEVPGLGVLENPLTPQIRDTHKIYEHEVSIQPYSMQFQTPSMRLSAINSIVTGIILPSMPLMQQQGLGLDMKALLKIMSKYSDLPELEELVTDLGSGGMGMDPGEMSGEETPSTQQPRQAATTHRVNERVSRSGGTREGSDRALVASLMGGGQGGPPGPMG